MKTLSKQNKEIILSFGYPKEDLKQIEKALKYTDFEILTPAFNKDKKIDIQKAIEILGEKQFLSGMCRSAFHWSAVREGKNKERIYFNSSKLFK